MPGIAAHTDTFSQRNMTRSRVPVLPYEEMKNKILGASYELSLAFIGSVRARKLNHTLRGKNKPANVLSFPLSETSGEITLCPERIKAEAKLFDHSYKTHMGFMFIHGLLHLKGEDHGSRMESEERRFMKFFQLR